MKDYVLTREQFYKLGELLWVFRNDDTSIYEWNRACKELSDVIDAVREANMEKE